MLTGINDMMRVAVADGHIGIQPHVHFTFTANVDTTQ